MRNNNFSKLFSLILCFTFLFTQVVLGVPYTKDKISGAAQIDQSNNSLNKILEKEKKAEANKLSPDKIPQITGTKIESKVQTIKPIPAMSDIDQIVIPDNIPGFSKISEGSSQKVSSNKLNSERSIILTNKEQYIIPKNSTYEQNPYYIEFPIDTDSKTQKGSKHYTGSNTSLSMNAISGVISLPTNVKAPAGGIWGYVSASNDQGNRYYQSFNIPEGENFTAYTISVENTTSGYLISYNLSNGNNLTQYVSRGYYSSQGTTNYNSVTLINVNNGDVDGINLSILTGNIITGTVSLPLNMTAPEGGISGSIYANLPINNSGYGNGFLSNYTIPAGESTANYSITVPVDPSIPGYLLNYSIYSQYSNGFISAGYYSTGGTVLNSNSATLVGVNTGNISGINFTILKGNTISGTISLPEGMTAPSNGIQGYISVTPQNGGNGYYGNYTIPEGQGTANYSVTVPVDTSISGYRVQYRFNSNYSGYLGYGYYSTSGTTCYSSLATLVNVNSGNVTGINLLILLGNTISGKIIMPNGETAQPGSISGNITVEPVNGGDIIYGNFYIPQGSSSANYSVSIPLELITEDYRVGYQFYTNSLYSGYVSSGYYAASGTTNYYSASIVNVSQGDVTGINLTLLKGNTISGLVSMPTGTVAPSGGIAGSVTFQPQFGGNNYIVNFNIPGGGSSASYSATIPVDTPITGYRVGYTFFYSQYFNDAYLGNGYYSTSGTTNYGSATLVNTANGNVSGIDLTILKTENLTDDYGNSMGLASVVTIGTNIFGQIDYNGDADFFKFTCPQSGTFIIGTQSNIDTYGYLYNASGNEIIRNDDNGPDANFMLRSYLQANQVYYIKAKHFSTGTGSYSFKVSSSTALPVKIALNKYNTVLEIGKTEQLHAVVGNAIDKSVRWSISNQSEDNTATVSDTGLVTANQVGTLTVMATSNADPTKYAECNVTVIPLVVPITAVLLNKSSTTIEVGETEQLIATITPDNASNKSITWSIYDGNDNAVTVSDSGLVTALKPGTAIIRATSNANSSIYSQCEVTVPSVIRYEVTGGEILLDVPTGTIWSYTGSPTYVTIPSQINGINVTRIENQTFMDCTSLINMTIPDSVSSIGQSAFEGCINLKSMNIPYRVPSIEYSTFKGCVNLINIDLSEGLIIIGDSAFYGCTSLAGIDIPKSVKIIDVCAFADCSSLISMDIPQGVTSIRDSVFSGCTNLSNINIANSVTSIGGGAFYKCTSLRSLNLPDSVLSIGGYAFTCCSNLTSINIPYGVTSIEEGTFYYCSRLVSIDLPDSLKFINDNAFLNCYDLTSVNLPNGLLTIGSSAFGNCYNLTGLDLPDSLKNIGSFAFTSCSNIIGINIPYGVTSIDNGVFDGCQNLKSVNIPNSVTSIGDYSFYCCYQLESINIPDSVTSIGFKTFAYCDSLTSIEIPDRVTSIGDYAFESTGLSSINIPNSITSIGQGVFDSSCLTSVILPYNIMSIGQEAFNRCFALTSISLPASVTRIDSGAFSNCYNLTGTYFYGNVPITFGQGVFEDSNYDFKIYYRPSATGWTTPYWNGYPTETFDPSSIPISIAVNPNNPFVGQEVTFDASRNVVGSDIETCEWDFGDGTSGSGVICKHTFNHPGDYIVDVIINYEAGYTQRGVIEVKVDNPAFLMSNTQNPAPGEEVEFSSVYPQTPGTPPISSYDWDFGDGSKLTGVAQSVARHAYSSEGDYTVTLVVNLEDGSSLSSSIIISVRSNFTPAGLVTYAINATASTPGEVYLNKQIKFDFIGGNVILSSSEGGAEDIYIDDKINITVTHEDGTTKTFSREIGGLCNSIELTDLFKIGRNNVHVTLTNTTGTQKGCSNLWISSVYTPSQPVEITGPQQLIQSGDIKYKADKVQTLSDGTIKYSGNVSINDFLKLDGSLEADPQGLEVKGNGRLYMETTSPHYHGTIEFFNGEFTLNADAAEILKKSGMDELTVAGLSVKINKLRLMLEGIVVAGSLELPESMGGGGIEIDNLQVIGGVVDVAGTITLPELTIGKSKLGLHDATMEFDTQENKFTGHAILEIPKVFGIEGSLGLQNARLEQVGFGITNMNLAIDASGFFLQRIYGELAGVSQPPLKITAESDVTGGPKVAGVYAIAGKDLTISVDLAGNVTGSGTLNLFNVYDLSEAYFKMNYYKGFSASASINILDILEGNAYIKIEKENKGTNFEGSAKVALVVPDSVELIGGKTLSEQSVSIDTQGIKGDVKLGSASVGYWFNWQGQWGFNSNISLHESSIRNTRELKPMDVGNTFIISQGTQQAIVRLNWDNGDTDFSIITPDGVQINPVDAPETSISANFFKNITKREAFYVLYNPKAGTWHYTITNANLGNYTISNYTLEAKPTLTIGISNPNSTQTGLGNQVQDFVANGPIEVTWQVSSLNTTLDLYYDQEGQGHVGNIIAADLNPSIGSYTWDPTGLPSGTYYVYGKLKDGVNAPTFSYSLGTIRINNPDTPLVPKNLIIRAVNGKLMLKWDPNIELDLAGYKLHIINHDPQIEITVPLQTSFDLEGLETNQSYQIAISAYDNDGIESGLSQGVEVFLPTPIPPSLVVNWPEKTVTNINPLTITGQIESGASGEVYLNEIKLAENLSDSFTRKIVLKPGNNDIKVLASKPNGDTAEDSRSYYYDNIPPQLTVDKLTKEMEVTQPFLQVNGTAEKTATLTLNNLPVTVNEQGLYSKTLTLLKGANLVVLTVTDKAGNSTTFNGVVNYSSTLPTPTNLIATQITNDQVTLSWDKIIDVDSYNIYRADLEEGDYDLIGNSLTNTYTDTGLNQNTTYWYMVSAIKDVKEGLLSSQLKVTTLNNTIIQFGATNYDIAEENSLLSIEVTFSGNAANPVSVDYSTQEGTAIQVQDFEAISGTITFGPNETTKTITIPITNDSTYEQDETFKIILSNPSTGAELGDNIQAVITIAENDYIENTGTIEFLNFEGGFFGIICDNGQKYRPVNEPRNVKDGDIINFKWIDTGNAAGFQMWGKPIRLLGFEIVGNVNQLQPKFPELNTLPKDNSNDPKIPNPSIKDSIIRFEKEYYHVKESSSVISLTIIKTGDINSPCRVEYTTYPITAEENKDYEGLSGVMTFNTGESHKEITIKIQSDNLQEYTEKFKVALSNPTKGASLGSQTEATVEIEDATQQSIGTVQYIEANPCFYGIITEEGEKLFPIELPRQYAKDGLGVRFVWQPIKDKVSPVGWGTTVKMIEIELVDGEIRQKKCIKPSVKE